MVIKHRSTTPSLIIGVGVASILAFAFGVKWTGTSPILKLKPALEKQYGARGFRCWLKVDDHRIEIRPPESLPIDRASRRQVGGWALLKYYDLCEVGKPIAVEYALVISPKGMNLPDEEVNRLAAEAGRDTEAEALPLVQGAAEAAGTSATIASVGPGLHGAAIFLAPAPGSTIGETEARGLARTVLAKDPRVAFVRVDRGNGIAYEAGVDVAVLGSTSGAPALPPVAPR